MENEYYKKSSRDGRKYNLFDTIIIINYKQSAFYESRGVKYVEYELSTDRKSGEPIWTWTYVKSETKEVFDEWCKRQKEER